MSNCKMFVENENGGSVMIFLLALDYDSVWHVIHGTWLSANNKVCCCNNVFLIQVDEIDHISVTKRSIKMEMLLSYLRFLPSLQFGSPLCNYKVTSGYRFLLNPLDLGMLNLCFLPDFHVLHWLILRVG